MGEFFGDAFLDQDATGSHADLPLVQESTPRGIAGSNIKVGVVEKSAIIDGSTIVPGDVVIGLPSSGAHSNG